MKLILTLLTILFFFNCQKSPLEPETITETIIITNENPPDTNTPPPPIGPVDFFIYENNNIYVNSTKTFWTNTHATYAGNFRIAMSNVLYFFDTDLNITNAKWLPTIPSKIAMQGTNIFITVNIPPQEALDRGALYKDYTEIYKNNTIINTWYLTQYKVKKLFLSKDNTIIIKKDNNTFIDLESIKQDIFYSDETILIYDYNATTKQARFLWDNNNYLRSWTYNYLGNSINFQIANGDLYSPNGYRIKADGTMLELENQLTNFNILIASEAQQPSKLLVKNENGEDVTYWLEGNSGNVYRHIPSINDLSIITSFYSGDGLASTGQPIAQKLNSKFIDSYVYYFYNDVTWQWDFGISINFGGVMEIWE